MNDASNFPESEQPEQNPTASDAVQEADANTSAQAQTPAYDNAAAARTCPQCGAPQFAQKLAPGLSAAPHCGQVRAGGRQRRRDLPHRPPRGRAQL